MTLSNAISLLRLVGSVAVFFVFLAGYLAPGLWFFLFALALALSDLIDGMIARRNGEVSDAGALLDTLADKAFILLLLGAFVYRGAVANGLLIFALLAFREAYIMALKVYMRYEHGYTIHAGSLGKIKMVFEAVAVCGFALGLFQFSQVFLYVAVILAYSSAIAYVRLVTRFHDSKTTTPLDTTK